MKVEMNYDVVSCAQEITCVTGNYDLACMITPY